METSLFGAKVSANRVAKMIAASALAIAFALAGAPNASSETKLPFPRPAAIQPNVDFWVNVFTRYSDHDFVIVDRDNVQRIYHVFHLPGDGQPTRSDIEWANSYLKIKYGDMLNRLASGREPANDEEREVAAMFKGEPRSAYAAAAQNLRVQEGLREQFHDGLLRSRYYEPSMERIFRNAGLPPELVTLASVESGFHGAAHSSAGAVGIWQFTRGTGKHYMKITRYHDDRLIPERETLAAAKLLRSNYDTLGDWPLAITAYNYGTGGVARAAGIYGGDYSEMVRHYQGPHFGFAVKNYYSEFLAALQVHRDEEKYFPGIEDEPAIRPAPIKADFAPKRSKKSHRSHTHHASSKTHHSKKTIAQKT
jgi:membrane-bound lytic murein transglycosylase D